jgi:hypothetical protein
MRVDVVSRACVVGLIGISGGSAFGGFQLVSHSHVVDAERRETTFTLEFNQRPDLDDRHVGRPSAAPDDARTFQVFYGSHHEGPDVLGHDVVVLRGPEIAVDGDLRVRDTLGVDKDPDAGGFGPVRGSVPFELLDNETVAFTVPWQLLGERDDSYRFTIESYEAGELTGSASVVAPLPPALWPALTVLGGTLMTGVARQRVRRRH